MSTSMLREELPNFLRSHNYTFDYIFCTGDIRTAPQPFPDEAADYLIDLCSTTDTPIKHLFIVPGNHDVNRTASDRDEAIKKVCFNRTGYYDPQYKTIQEDDLRAIQGGLDDFRNFLSKVYKDVPERLELYNNMSAPHFNVETPDFNVLHVDTTITYTEGQEAYDLIVGSKLLQNAFGSLNPEKPTILITHYPFSSLLQEEKKHVRELLHSKGVRLWLAGHEHDHILQPYGYLDSIQAGELRAEERTNATVLIGEYDPDTLSGTISAYTWFPEGWAKYPIINHDGEREDEYSFTLRLPGDNGRSREVVKAECVNKEYFNHLPEKIMPELFPDIEFDSIESTSSRIVSNFEEELISSWNSSTPHIILLGDGGMGKTTMLLDACRKMQRPALYISAERLASIGVGIKEYCVKVLFDGDERRFDDFTIKKYTTPSLVLFIDGLNEVNGSAERRFIRDLSGLNLQRGIQIIISSRSDFSSHYRLSGFEVGKVLPLQDEQIESLFSSNEWIYIKDTVTLHRLLSNPMMLTMYKEVSLIIRKHSNIEFLKWVTPINTTTDLLRNYYISQIAVMLDRSGIDPKEVIIAFQTIKDILPALAYIFELNYSLYIRNDEFRKILGDIIDDYKTDENAVAPIEDYYRCYDIQPLKAGQVTDVLTKATHLLYQDNEAVSFPHQIYRDFLSAEWIYYKTVECADDDKGIIDDYWNSRSIPFPVMEHIRNLSGAYWEKGGIAEKIHDAAKGRDDAFDIVGNLLDCFPMKDNTGVPDYSGLDLRGLRIPDIKDFIGVNKETAERISLKNARIDNLSIGKIDSQQAIITGLQFSEDNQFLAAATNNRVSVYSLGIPIDPFEYPAGNVSRLVFSERYLFALARNVYGARIYVFSNQQDTWVYNGEISGTNDNDIFNKRLRFIVLSNDMLYFYYNNRMLQYRLSDCIQIANIQKKHIWENPVKGKELNLQLKNRQRRNKSTGLSASASHDGLTATAYFDGRLVVTSGREVQYVLARGITLLKDGSISEDGTKAATLSYELFQNKRKIQLWDLSNKIKTGELFCSYSIEKIHMSDNGTWIFGETDNSTCVINIETGSEEWFDEHFISNQRGKRTSFGDKVLRKDDQNLLYLYDLRTGEKTALANSCKNARIACFMPDGSVASVGNNVRKLKFKNIRTGTYSEIDTNGPVILGLQALKNQPFIAVATNDGIISIYHIGDGKRKRIIGTHAGNYMMIVHPVYNIVANSDGNKKFETHNYYEKAAGEKRMGWWYSNPYGAKDDPPITGNVLDLAFNTTIHELVVILDNGQIVFCNEKYCRYHGKLEIITSFDVAAYDFRECVCDDELRQELQQNGAVI